MFSTKSVNRYVASALIAFLLLLGPFVFVQPVRALDPPIHVHLTWQHETNTTMTVTWQTSASTSGDIVKYDTVSRGGVPGDYSYSATGTNYTYGGASGYIHDIELTGLTPNTTYYFICGGDTGGYSGERAFRTAPSVPIKPGMPTYVKFVMGGDSRTNEAERDKISQAMAKFNPAFVMHDGDLVADGTSQSQWDSWFTDVDSHWVGENNLTIPVIPVVGNHENPGSATCKYYVQFALPGNEKYYSYDWGPDIHIICLDSELVSPATQAAWLESDLINHSSALWKFAIFHRPPFVSGNHDPWLDARTYWVPLFDKYHVDIVVCGHEHSYQRSYPLNWTASQTKTQDYSNGTEYIVAGAWGAPLYDPTPIWYMAYQRKIYHFCLVEINGTSLHLQAKDNLGNTFDEITIEKAPPIGVRARFTYTPQRNLPFVNETVTFDASASDAGNGTHYFPIENYTWDFGDDALLVTETDPITTHNYTAPGEYTVTLNATALNTTDNSLIWGTESKTIKVYVPSHDIVMTNVTLFKTVVGQGYKDEINVTVENQGTFPENFNVTVYYQNATYTGTIGTQAVTNLAPLARKLLVFIWTTDAKVKRCQWYTIIANASIVPGETDTADNKFTKANAVKVTIPGDVDGDGEVYTKDLGWVGKAWRAKRGQPKYIPNADTDCDGEIYTKDLGVIGKYWRKKCL